MPVSMLPQASPIPSFTMARSGELAMQNKTGEELMLSAGNLERV
jgi:hypothetical protein